MPCQTDWPLNEWCVGCPAAWGRLWKSRAVIWAALPSAPAVLSDPPEGEFSLGGVLVGELRIPPAHWLQWA